MSQPVWTLSVDLQTKTATFQTGMADAAKAARSSFTDIKAGAEEMGRETSGSMGEARHGLKLLEEEFGIHVPRGINMFLSSLGPVAGAMEAAFPFLAIIVGATLLIEHLSKVGEAAKKAAEAGEKAFTSSAHSLTEASAKSLELQIKLAELAGAPVDKLETKLRAVKDLLASMKLAPELKTEFAEFVKSIQIPTAWNPLNWFGESAAASKEVKAEAMSAALAIANATTLEEKQANAGRELSRARMELSDIQKSGNQQAIEDQERLIRLLQETKQNMDLQVSNHKDENKIDDEARVAKAAREQDRIDAIQQRGLERYVRLREEAERRTSELKKKEAREEEQLGEAKLHADESFLKVMKEELNLREKLANEGAREDAGHGSKMAELQLAADKEAGQMRVAQGRMTLQQISDMEMGFAAQEYNAKRQALQNELAALEGNGAEVENKKRALNNRLLELDAQFHNQEQTLEDQAQKKQLASAALLKQRLSAEYAQGFTSWIMGKQNFAQMMRSLDEKMLEQAITSQLQYMLQKGVIQEMERFGDARTAAANAYAQSGGNPIVGSIDAAIAFAAVMGMQEGGIVPGVGNGDIVPARLEPGEGVLTKRQMEGVINSAKFGNGDKSGGDVHVHYHHTSHVQAFDSAGVDKVLQQHGDKFIRHATDHIRRLNR